MLVKSQILTQMSGSIGGVTGSHNAGGLYLRARAIPVNPNTTQQQSVRNAMTILTGRWVSVLTPAQRDAWLLYGDQVGLINPLGDTIQVSGISMYVRSNVARIQAGLAVIDNAPTTFNLGDFTSPDLASVSEATQQASVTFDDSDAWANEDGSSMLVYLSRPQNQTINYFKGPYRFAGTIDGDSGTPPTSPATFAVPFPVVTGQRVFMKVRVTREDGRLSGEFRDFVAVSA